MRPSIQLETIESCLANQMLTTQEIVPGQREAAVALVLQPQVSGLRAFLFFEPKKREIPGLVRWRYRVVIEKRLMPT